MNNKKETTMYDIELEMLRNKHDKEETRRKVLRNIFLWGGIILAINFLIKTAIKIGNEKNQKIIANLEIYQENVLNYIEQEDFLNAEFELNKMVAFIDLPSTEKTVWASNRDILIRLYEEKSGKEYIIPTPLVPTRTP